MSIIFSNSFQAGSYLTIDYSDLTARSMNHDLEPEPERKKQIVELKQDFVTLSQLANELLETNNKVAFTYLIKLNK